MPKLEGMSVARALRALPHGQSLPIIALSSNAMSPDRQAALAVGMTDFVTKPIDPFSLYAKVRQALPQKLEDSAHSQSTERVSDSAPETNASPQAVAGTLQQLEQLLKHGDTAALGMCKVHAATLTHSIGADYQLLIEQVKQFDFEQALVTLNRHSGSNT
jgi:DNA-binding response OmpR family regulator